MKYYYIPIVLGQRPQLCWILAPNNRQFLEANNLNEAFDKAEVLFHQDKKENLGFGQFLLTFPEFRFADDLEQTKNRLKDEYPKDLSVIEIEEPYLYSKASGIDVSYVANGKYKFILY